MYSDFHHDNEMVGRQTFLNNSNCDQNMIFYVILLLGDIAYTILVFVFLCYIQTRNGLHVTQTYTSWYDIDYINQ